MSKVTVVGAGNVGATCANVLVTTQVGDEVVVIDIKAVSYTQMTLPTTSRG